ncbi:MAG: DUF4062 domain-containing protein [Phycisphaeraceae bacterium]
MAKPRIFVSSTYFDLRVVRADLERFIKENGYEPVLFESGHIPYGNEDALEEYCYREISTCDILIAIIGGKYGTQSQDQKHSITQRELKTAIELGKQIYVFVEKYVHSEYRTYRKNKDVKGFTPVAVTDARVYEFLDEITALPAGNPIEAFETSEDIVRFLREQWAGLFQRLLQESGRQKEINIVASMKATAETLNHLVTFLTEQRTKGDEAIKDILLSSHPAFGAIRTAANVPYRVVFHTFQELETLLSVRGFTYNSHSPPHEWYNQKAGYGIRVSAAIFEEDGKLRIIMPDDWDDGWVDKYELQQATPSYMEDDIPF